MSILPATAVLIGVIVLRQVPASIELVGVALVIGGVLAHREAGGLEPGGSRPGSSTKALETNELETKDLELRRAKMRLLPTYLQRMLNGVWMYPAGGITGPIEDEPSIDPSLDRGSPPPAATKSPHPDAPTEDLSRSHLAPSSRPEHV